MIVTRSTVADLVEIDGVGLHSGTPVKLRIHPSQSGIEFRFGTEKILAVPGSVTDTSRCTRLGSVSTVEHLMAALAALEVTDATIEVSSAELPAADGCSRPYLTAISEAGLTSLGTREIPGLFRRLFLQEGDIKIAVGKGVGHWRYEYETGSRWPFSMNFETPNVVDDFEAEIASARTFAHHEEIAAIRAAGLAKGLSEDSALILGPSGYLNSPRFDTEPARHKLLDLIGDLYLSGVPIRTLNAVGTRSGHRTNVQMAMMLHTAVCA
jgi:UDP-3-O-[3-hydroxymyristoyl] N-acetylglucosamine deacetylase